MNINEALAEAEESNGWKCETCSAPKNEGERYCFYCKMYREDVAAGLYDNNPEDEYQSLYGSD